MRSNVSRLCLAALALSAATRLCSAAEAGRESFNNDWRFQLEETPGGEAIALSTVRGWLADFHAAKSGTPTTQPTANVPALLAAAPAFDDSAWRSLRLPHDWAIEGPFVQELSGETGKRPFAGVAWYRKTFTITDADAGRPIFLDFDGAMSHACVWINGQFAGGWPFGYASFRVDATKLIKPGQNVVAVRLQNPPNSSRWYPGAGIYRNVWLVKSAPVHVAQWGVQVTTPEITDASAAVRVVTTVENTSQNNEQVEAVVELFEAGPADKATGPALASAKASIDVAAGESARPAVTLAVNQPKRWSVESPNRYVARVRLEKNGQTIDQYDQTFGIRTAVFTADNGFLLNGKRMPLQGVCEHHDLGALGSALNTRAMERKLELLKSMGVNALRTTHNPPAPEVLELCDRLGVVVLDESFDCWRRGKNENDYGKLFDTWSERDVRALVRRDRNHPSVIAWSIGNEILEQGGKKEDVERHMRVGQRLTDLFKAEDPTRPTTAAFNHPASGFDGMNRVVDIMGFNYKPHLYGRFHNPSTTQPSMGTETSSTISSRGEYFFPVSNDKKDGKANFQMSSYDLYAPPWATTADGEFAGQDKTPAVAGEFVWTGFDYIGEPTPYNRDTTNLLNFSDPAERAKADAELKALGKLRVPSRSSYFGILDLAGFPKDRFYLYQARWRPDLPMAHILPHWNWPDRVGQVTPVHVYTSGDEAELFLNGKSLGRKTKAPFTYRLRWDDVVYEPGELKVVAYKAGQPWAEQTVKTTGPAAQLKLSADRSTIAGDGDDLSFVTLSVTDANGLTVPQTSPLVRFTVEGPGEIVATDNGNAIDPDSFQSPDRRAYNGLALAIVRGKPGAKGTVKITAAAEGLAPATAEIQLK